MNTEQIIEWRWRIRWGRRWTTSKLWQTEDEVRREHAEATKIDASQRVRITPAPIDTMYRPAETIDPAIEMAWRGRTPGEPPKG